MKAIISKWSMVNGQWFFLFTIDHLLFTLFSPLHKHAAPRHAAAEGGEQHKVAACELPLLNALVERDGNRGRRGVAVIGDVRVDDCGVNVEPRSHGLRDALVRLVRDEKLHVGG